MSNLIEDKVTVSKPRSCFAWSSILLWFAILALFGATGVFYYQQMMMNYHLVENATDLRNKQTVLFQEVQQQKDMLAGLDKTLQDLRAVQAEKKLIRDKEAVIVAEAQYLVKMANDQLHIISNVPQAVSLLRTADQLLQGLSDPNVSSVRQALTADIAAFQNVAKIDINGIYARLISLDQQVEKLALPTDTKPLPQVTTEAGQANSWWQRGLQQSLAALKQIVVIRHWQDNKMPFILPEQKDFLYQNMHAMFARAIWALLHQDQEIYTSSLAALDTWSHKYFVDDTDTQLFIKNLHQLGQEQISTVIPDLSQTINALQKYFKTKNDNL